MWTLCFPTEECCDTFVSVVSDHAMSELALYATGLHGMGTKILLFIV
jgi:hypothetical protein